MPHLVGLLLEPSHRLPLMLLPVTNVVPLLLEWLPHPKALYCGELGIGGHIRRDQQQRATSGATSLPPKSEIPLAVRALVTPRSQSHKSLPRARSLSPHPCPDKLFNPCIAARAGSRKVMRRRGCRKRLTFSGAVLCGTNVFFDHRQRGWSRRQHAVRSASELI